MRSQVFHHARQARSHGLHVAALAVLLISAQLVHAQTTAYAEWLNIQRGVPPTRTNTFDPTPRSLHSGRGLAEYVHHDFTYQAALHACLILSAMRAPLKVDNPYTRSLTQGGFVTFGAPHVLDLVARVANASLKATWCHKWLIHRRLRPEECAGRIHNHLSKAARYPLHEEVLNASAISTVFRAYGSYLLPMAYPGGCPTHPAYPAGHAAIAGACTTVLKAFFNEAFVIPSPVVTIPDGLREPSNLTDSPGTIKTPVSESIPFAITEEA